MLMTLRIFRVIVGFIAIWQVIGLLPVLTWFSNLSAVTANMLAFVVGKSFFLLIFSTTFYWLGRAKKKYESTGVTTSELPAIGLGVCAFFVLAIVFALVIPNPNGTSFQQSGTMASHTSVARQDQQQNGNASDTPSMPIASQPIQQQSSIPDWARDQPTPAAPSQQQAPESAAVSAPSDGYVVVKPTPPSPPSFDTANRLTLNFRDVSIRAVLQLISEVSGTPIYVDQAVNGNVDVSYVNLPWDFVLKDVIEKHGYTMSVNNGAIYVRRAQVAQFSRAAPPVKPKPKCEYKAVMTNEDIALCRADANM